MGQKALGKESRFNASRNGVRCWMLSKIFPLKKTKMQRSWGARIFMDLKGKRKINCVFCKTSTVIFNINREKKTMSLLFLTHSECPFFIILREVKVDSTLDVI